MNEGTSADFKSEADRRRDALLGLTVPTLKEQYGADLSGMPGASKTSNDAQQAETLLLRCKINHARASYRDAVVGSRRRISLLVHAAAQNFGHLNRCFDLTE